MKNLCRQPTGWVGGLILTVCALMAPSAAAAAADDGDVENIKPAIYLMISTSSSMGAVVGGRRVPTCSQREDDDDLPDDPDDRLQYEKSQMMVLKEVLTGAPVGPTWCVYDDRSEHERGDDDDNLLPHARAVCCKELEDNRCEGWEYCWADDGRDADWDDVNPIAFEPGLIDDLADGVKFGLMTSDSHPDKGGGDDTWSYGDEAFNLSDAIVEDIPDDEERYVFGIAEDVDKPNLGIRDGDAKCGPLIDANRGIPRDRNREISEAPDEVASHNQFIKTAIRNLVPLGGRPIAAMLRDALEHLEEAADDDDLSECRRRAVVLFIDGAPSEYYGGQPCRGDGGCENPGVCEISQLGQGACFYGEGFPYEQSTDYAEQFLAQGIPLYIIGLGLEDEAEEFAADVAEAATPAEQRDPEENPRFFNVSTEEELRAALLSVRNGLLYGARSSVRPIVLSPTQYDKELASEEPGREEPMQWRISAYTEIPDASDRYWYGKIVRREMVCRNEALKPQDEDVEFGDALNDRGARRRTFARHPTEEDADLVVMGGNQAAFLPDGVRGAAFTEDELLELLDVEAEDDPDGEPPADDAPEAPMVQMRRVGRLLGGHFGERGLPDGLDGETGRRNLGPMTEGTMAVIGPPLLGLTTRGYRHFTEKHRERATMLAVGANDGMVHIFRLVDGRELFNFVPQLAWSMLHDAERTFPVDGPLTVRDIAVCRSTDGRERVGCAPNSSTAVYRTMLVGGIGRSGANLFGIDVSQMGLDANAESVLGDDEALELDRLFPDQQGAESPWNFTREIELESEGSEDRSLLGLSVSKPALTHVRNNGTIVGAIVVGCGDDPRPDPLPIPDLEATGRCVLVLSAQTGELIRRITHTTTQWGAEVDLENPIVGWPAVFPRGGAQAANYAYVGDRMGVLFRVDLTAEDPDDWVMRQIWPEPPGPGEDDDGEPPIYLPGRAILGRPSVATQLNGSLAVVFVTGGPPEVWTVDAHGDNVQVPAYAVSLSEGFNEEGVRVASMNWVLQLRENEVSTAEPIVRSSTMFFTTREDEYVDPENACWDVKGRLYGVHYTDTQDRFGFDNGDVGANVVPMLFDGALAYLLPEGTVAHGMTIIATPSCVPGEGVSTEIILNRVDNDSTRGNNRAANPQGVVAEHVGDGRVRRRQLNADVFSDGTDASLAVSLTPGDNAGENAGARPADRLGPFPSVIFYWGTSFAE